MPTKESNLNLPTSGRKLYSASFHMRCPECFKSYMVDWVDVHEAQPRFACVACQTHFCVDAVKAIQGEGEIIGQKLEAVELNDEAISGPITPQSIFNCPKCTAQYSAGELECKKCGVIFLKFAEHQMQKISEPREVSFSASAELKGLWDDVLNDFESEITHQKFINASWSEGNLEYASAKYAGILEVVPHDEWSLRAQKRIQDLNEVQFEMQAEEDGHTLKKWYEKLDFLELAHANFKKLKLTNLIMIVCAFVIVMGVFTPGLRNLIGFGTSVLFFILALRFYFRVI